MKSNRSQVSDKPRDEIASIIARYHASGLGLKTFARQQGLPPGRLHYWIYQKYCKNSSRQNFKPAKPLFREIQLPLQPVSVCSWEAEVALPAGLSVRFSGKTSPEWIGAVVHALQRLC